jgi:hypothetical protein
MARFRVGVKDVAGVAGVHKLMTLIDKLARLTQEPLITFQVLAHELEYFAAPHSR